MPKRHYKRKHHKFSSKKYHLQTIDPPANLGSSSVIRSFSPSDSGTHSLPSGVNRLLVLIWGGGSSGRDREGGASGALISLEFNVGNVYNEEVEMKVGR